MKNKIYFDPITKTEIVDVSGKKDIEQLKKDFNCPALIDVTKEKEAQFEKEKLK
jgi:hypothetical protein